MRFGGMAIGIFLCAAHSAFALDVTLFNNDPTGHALARFDIDGNALDAHDGDLRKFGNGYYLYGTSYGCGYEYQGNANFCGFKVYSSPDLEHWTDRGFAVPPGNCRYCFRPHVLYNASTKTYVMWTDAGGAYGIYASSSPTGPFTRKPNPSLAVGGYVDEAVFQDDDGTGWLIHNSTIVAAGLTADMVVEKMTPDYLGVTGEYAKLGLGDVEGFAVFKREGIYHALMSDPSCAYCAGATGEMTAKAMLGPWSGKWYDSAGVHQSGRAEPRWRARIVNPDNCGGQPLATPAFPREDGAMDYYFVSDRWRNRAPNESLADIFIGRLDFTSEGVLKDFACVDSIHTSLKDAVKGSYRSSSRFDQGSGYDGFRHYCDVAGNTQRWQSFTPSRKGILTEMTVTTFQQGHPDAPLIVDLLDAGSTVLYSGTVAAAAIPWAPHVVGVKPNVDVDAGKTYWLRMRSDTKTGCYGWEYNDGNPYGRGVEGYSTNAGASIAEESVRDLKFTADVEGPTVRLEAGRIIPLDRNKPRASPGLKVHGRDAAGRSLRTATAAKP